MKHAAACFSAKYVAACFELATVEMKDWEWVSSFPFLGKTCYFLISKSHHGKYIIRQGIKWKFKIKRANCVL